MSKANEALDKMAENARELGLDYEPAQQEPFGYFRYDLRLDAWVQNREGRPGTPFYTSPPAQRKPLTDEEWQSIADTLDCSITRGQKDAIEAALGIKENT